MEMTVPPDDIDASGNYHCKATEHVGQYTYFTIFSNNIQIRDIIYWKESTK